MIRLIFGSGRFNSTVTNNTNIVLVGGFDIPTKLVDEAKDVALCLPENLDKWGMYPTHQDSWLCLAFVVGCHSRHEDEGGLEIRRQAFEQIPAEQWPALTAMAFEFAGEFRERLGSGDDLSDRKVYKSLTRTLQDCMLYLLDHTFPEDQDAFLAESPIADLIAAANAGRAGKLSPQEGLKLADEVDEIVDCFVSDFGGIEACREALAQLQVSGKPGRVILLPGGISLEQGAELAEYDLIIGTPDEHDLDCISMVGFVSQPTLFQLRDVLSEQRMDIIAVPPTIGPQEELSGGHPSFQSVAEMLLANGTPVSGAGQKLFDKLAGAVNPVELARKYLEVAKQFLSDATFKKSWAARRNDPSVPQIKKAIPLYRVACDLLPRASHMLRTGQHTGGLDIAELSAKAGLAAEHQAIRSFLDAQDASQEELEAVAGSLENWLRQKGVI